MGFPVVKKTCLKLRFFQGCKDKALESLERLRGEEVKPEEGLSRDGLAGLAQLDGLRGFFVGFYGGLMGSNADLPLVNQQFAIGNGH